MDHWTTVLASKAPAQVTTFRQRIIGAMGIILWCFVCVESLTILAEKAESQHIIGRATIISIIVALIVYIAISVVAMGIVPAEQLAVSGTPLAEVLTCTDFGNAGAIIVKAGIVVSLLGALISWVMITAQLPYIAAKEEVFPGLFAKKKSKGSSHKQFINFQRDCTTLSFCFFIRKFTENV